MDENVNGKAEVLCRVCGDKASGKHYGVASCDGCRGFFKRSIRRNLEYVCKENGRCIVDVTRRNQCQACRFRKCLQVNMKRDAVQHERAPRSCMPMHHHVLPASPQHLQAAFPVNAPVFAGFTAAAKRLHTMGAATAAASLFAGLPLPLPSHPLATHGAIIDPAMLGHTTGPDASYFSHGFLYPSVFAAANFSNKPSSSTIHFSSSSGNTLVSHKIHQNETFMPSSRQLPIKDDEVSSSEEAAAKVSLSTHITENTQSEILVADDNRLTNAGTEPSKTTFRPLDISCLTLLPAENVYESAAKLLFLSVKWARTIPSFLQLSYRDQNILLEESWSELFILTAAQWALPVDENALVNNAIAPSSRHAALEGDARRLRETIARLTVLRVDHTEYACLKALVLFKAECHGLCEPGHVELLQDQTHVMLNEYCNSSRCPPVGPGDASIPPGSGNHKAARFGKLLLALPSVKAISRRSLEELLFRKTIGDVAIERLLADMIKASDG